MALLLPVAWLPAGRGELRWPCCCLELVKCWCISKWHRSGLGADTPSGYFPVKGVELFLQCYRIPAPPLPHEARRGSEAGGPKRCRVARYSSNRGEEALLFAGHPKNQLPLLTTRHLTSYEGGLPWRLSGWGAHPLPQLHCADLRWVNKRACIRIKLPM
jgi:hypothetical protein